MTGAEAQMTRAVVGVAPVQQATAGDAESDRNLLGGLAESLESVDGVGHDRAGRVGERR